MKKLSIMLCVIALSAAVAACNDEKPKPTVAVVNAAQVYSECESGKQAREYLEKLAAEMQNDLLAMQSELENTPANQRQAAQEKLQATIVDYQQRIRMEEQQVLNKLSEDYQTTVDEYRKAHNLSLILRSEVLVSSAEEADITQAIIDAMNQKTEAENQAALAAQNATAEAPANATAEGSANATAGNATEEVQEIVVIEEEASTNATAQ